MFEQHPVPQQISSYQFRLVGDMTLKQFFQLAAGCLVGLLVYASPLPSFFKWPIIILVVIAGAAFAFLPLHDRPLSVWMMAFLRAIYGPTIFNWSKPSQKPQYFASNVSIPPNQPVHVATPHVSQSASVAKLEASENKFLSTITGVFTGRVTAQPASTVQTAQPIPQPPVSVAIKQPQPQPIAPAPAPRIIEINEAPKETKVEAQLPRAGEQFIITPVTPGVKVEPKGFTQVTTPKAEAKIETTNITPVTLPRVVPQNTVIAQFSAEAAPPTPPTIPNVIVGQITDKIGKIIEGAIMEIRDFQGRPVRALKTNKLGHFMIVTPLPSGSYTLTVEKEGVSFDPVSVEVHGAVVEPILIKAK